MDFVLLGTLIHPYTACYVISVRRFGSLPAKVPRLDIRLPSDSTSRWTPLPSANASYCRARCVLSPLSCCSCWAPYEKEDRICISASLSSFSVSISVWSGASIALIAFHSVLFPRRNREAWPAFSQVRPIPKNCVSFSLDAASLMTIFLSKALVAIATPPVTIYLPLDLWQPAIGMGHLVA